MFNSLGSRFTSIIKNFSLKSDKIGEGDLTQVLQDIRVALLDSDVNIKVGLAISNRIKEKAVGQKVVPGVSPQEMIVKIANDAIKEVLEGENLKHGLKIDENSEERILLVGLQGSGKTTTAAKLGKLFRDKKVVPILSSLDYYRPAARQQLRTLCERNGFEYFNYTSSLSGTDAALETLEHQIEFLKKNPHKVVILDTAGRISIDEKMMEEIRDVKYLFKPTQVILVLDGMSGKSAIDVARHFDDNLGLTGVIFTKVDSDAKCGAILSIRHMLNVPVLFLCSGEKIDDIDEFIPDRIAQRILGMGDIVSLVEKASSVIPNDESDTLKEKAKAGKLDLFDVLEQFKFLKKLGGLPFVSKFLPPEIMKNANVSDEKIRRFEAIILSMTPKERLDPGLVKKIQSRKNRVAKGSGVNVKLVDELLDMHSKVSKLAQHFAHFDKDSMMDKMSMLGKMKEMR
jgi:signal recognition particle subunit SRP54